VTSRIRLPVYLPVYLPRRNTRSRQIRPCLYGVSSGLLRLLYTMCFRQEVDATCHE
jgi:hypothetical protein